MNKEEKAAEKWADDNRGQYDEDDIAFAAFLAGVKWQSDRIGYEVWKIRYKKKGAKK